MQTGVYVVLSAQMALQKRLDTIAANVANAGTVGFRAEEVSFASFLSEGSGTDPVAFASAGETYISRQAGELVKTDNPLDIAVKGDAWFSIQTPSGQVYTRDGRMRMTDNGELQSLNGDPVLDVGGAPILLDASAGPPRIASDGMISQGQQQLGAVGLFRIPGEAKLARAGTSGVIPDRAAEPVLDFTGAGVVQGFVERSNVNPILEMARLIQVTRAFENVTATMNDSESTMTNSIRTLGSST